MKKATINVPIRSVDFIQTEGDKDKRRLEKYCLLLKT